MEYPSTFALFWERYGADDRMDVTAKGSKRKAFEAWGKAAKKWAKEESITDDIDEKFAAHVAHGYALHANNRRASKRVPNKFVSPLPHVATYLNQFRFEAEVQEGTGDLHRQSRAAGKPCACGGEFYGVSETGTPLCKPCHLREWYDGVKKSTDITTIRWRPQFMRDRYPKGEDETWPQWSARVAKEIIRDAPATSPLKWKPEARRIDDWEYFHDKDRFRTY